MSNNISNIEWRGGQATVTHSEPCGMEPGDDLTISGVTPSDFNGSWVMLLWVDTGTGSSCVVLMDDPGGPYISGGTIE